MKAIVDCNSFYCSCERVFKPHLDNKPVVVLSNNDGCIISRSREAEALGIGMAEPYFKFKSLIEANGVAVFSSNYNLYGDMSRRVMETLKTIVGDGNVEVYSVDEAFLDLRGFTPPELKELAVQIKRTIEQWTGVKVSVGVAPTKTLAKLANRIAKKSEASNGVAVLGEDEEIRKALAATPVDKIWGIGRQYAEKLCGWGIETAGQLRNVNEEWARKHLGGVTGIRLIKELRGEEAIVMQEQLVNKKMIATTRMFGNAVTELNDIKEAVATYTSRAAEKLRRQQSAANVINVFVVPKEKTVAPHFRHGPVLSKRIVLPQPTSVTHELIKPAVQLAEQLYEGGKAYKKAGVILSGLVPDDSIQGNLFVPGRSISRYLMEKIDNINFSMRNDVVKFAASGTKKNWKMRQDFHSPRYTTRWDELYEIK